MLSSTDFKPKKNRVLLIGWDGADWQHIHPLLDRGLLPTLSKLIDGGSIGNLATLQPMLSPMLWNSVATGKFADKHGIHGFVEPDEDTGGARPFSNLSRRCKAVWNIFSQVGLSSNVINWWASHPAEPIRGCMVSNLFNGVQYDPNQGWKISPGTIHPESFQGDWASLKFFPHELEPEHILPFIPKAAEIDQDNDPRLSVFATTFAEMMTTHSVATKAIEECSWDFMAIYYTGIDHFSHPFMPYHPPRMSHIPETDFEIYSGVIEGAYRFHDMMLARLLQLAGDDVTVILCSDHGFQSGSYRPIGNPREPAGPAAWHRQYGILVANGPGIKRDERIYGASLIDLGPTLLHLFGLPIGADMDGRPLLELFEEPEEVRSIPSWDAVPGNAGSHGPEKKLTSGVGSDELLKQFVALGYIDEQHGDKKKQSRSARIESKYNLARCLMWQGEYERAIPLLENILHECPWETRFIVQLADAYLKNGWLDDSERLLRKSFDLSTTATLQAVTLFADIKFRQRRFDEALELLQLAVARSPRFPEVYAQIGTLYGKLRKWKESEAAFRQAVDLNPDFAKAHEGRSTALLRQGKLQAAADEALQAVGLVHRLPRAHLNLGTAMARTGNLDRAEMAFQAAARFAPENPHPIRWLQFIAHQKGNIELSRRFGAQWQALSRTNSQFKVTQARDHLPRPLPPIPTESERNERLIKEHPRPSDIEPSGKTFVVVSGLPRSGTSLMMQMLAAAGKQPITDEVRKADSDNPHGYLEWEPIKQIKDRPELLNDVDHEKSVLKVISMLLPDLPKQHRYKIVFMLRDLDEVTASQLKMLERRQEVDAIIPHDELSRGLAAHRDSILKMIGAERNFNVSYVRYSDLVRHPDDAIDKVTDFLQLDPSVKPAMRSVVAPELYRNRREVHTG